MTAALPALNTTKTLRNVAPAIPAAGKAKNNPLDTVGTCVKYENERPPTPPNVMPYRKSRQEVGRCVIHHGKSRDTPPPDVRFGRRNIYDDNAVSLIRSNETIGDFARKCLEIKEGVYATVHSEPLGKSSRRNKTVKDDKETCYGRTTMASENSKAVIYPNEERDEETEENNHKKYCRTHNSYRPGEQKKRSYDWQEKGIDPNEYRFGYVVPSERGGVSQAMTYGRDTKTVLVKKTVEDFKDVHADDLGKPRNHGFGDQRNLSPKFTFGKKNTADEWGVRECMAGNINPEDMEDKTLGKATRPGYRNDTETVSFGMPSVRVDIRRPGARKVTDNNNYGDDCNAYNLLCPSKYAVNNVHEEVCYFTFLTFVSSDLFILLKTIF